MNLKLISLLISIVGITILFLLVSILPPLQVYSQSDLKENSLVQVEGKVISERNYSDFSILKLDNNITATCNCKGFINKSVEIEGKVTNYEGDLQVQAYKIKEKIKKEK